MKFWLDTEFYEDGYSIQLISIGVVSENGREYYAESPASMFLAGRTPWLAANVRPHLRGNIVNPFDMRKELIEFFGEKPEIWGYYADYDWVVLCQVFGRMIDLPRGWPMYCRDVKQLCDDWGHPKLPEKLKVQHDALCDARWTKLAWEYLDSLRCQRSSRDGA